MPQRAGTVLAKAVDYDPPVGLLGTLAVVPVPATGYTYLMDGRRLSVEGRETFYIDQADDLLMCAVGPGFVYLVPSFARTRTLAGGLPAAIAHFVKTVDDTQLMQAASREVTLNLRDFLPNGGGMWSRGAHAANPRILAKSVVDSVLLLDLQSASGVMYASAWIDLKEGKLLKLSYGKR
jgi:hypothetical protein